jgi:DNA polymerase
MHFSALQLAWMQELGIDKPWIPSASPVAITNTAARSATSAKPDAAPSGAARITSKPVKDGGKSSLAPQNSAESSGVNTFIQAGDLARLRMDVTSAPSGSSQRFNAAPPSGTKKSAEMPADQLLDTVTAAAQASTLEALAVTVAACNACGLCKEREQVVLGQGVLQPAIMVIGEGPGDQEDRQGLPFVGTTGVLLDNMLLSIGSSRQSDVYMANIVKCRPPSNRNPRPAEIEACRPFLLRQIELVRPVSILALGRFAAQALVGGEAMVEEMRDQPFTISHAGLNIPVVVSYHPGYLVHHPSDKAAAWRDLQRARLLSKGL